MQNYQNFKVYQPEHVPVDVLLLPDGRPARITWIRDDDGNDWYDIQQSFAEDTLKILYDSGGVILSHSIDVTELNPVNLSVAEVSLESVPTEAVGSLTDGTWCYIDGAIQARVYTDEELQQQAQEMKTELMVQADRIIAPLVRAVKYGEATQQEQASLEAWEKYSITLNRVNTSKPVWPDKPV